MPIAPVARRTPVRGGQKPPPRSPQGASTAARRALVASQAVQRLPAGGVGTSYVLRLGPGSIARIELERRGPWRYFVHWVYVPPGFRGCGVGEVLLRRVLRDADRASVTLSLVARACGTTVDQATLEAWYVRHGFVPGRHNKLGRLMTRPPRDHETRAHARRAA